jgi:hypothetical protein
LITAAAESHNTRLIAVFPQEVNKSRDYLAKQHINIQALKQLPLTTLGVRGTPTLILTDSKGVVIQAWEGMVSADVEDQVFVSLSEKN